MINGNRLSGCACCLSLQAWTNVWLLPSVAAMLRRTLALPLHSALTFPLVHILRTMKQYITFKFYLFAVGKTGERNVLSSPVIIGRSRSISVKYCLGLWNCAFFGAGALNNTSVAVMNMRGISWVVDRLLIFDEEFCSIILISRLLN